MGRKKKYNETEALERAMYLFWRKGYRAVSTRELANAMGINQYSMYASFQSKEVLFANALEQYLQTIICDWLIKPLVEQTDGLTAIRLFFETFVEPGDGTTPTGCLICNTIVEAENPPSDVQSVIDRYQSALSDAFAIAIRNSNPEATDQEIASKTDLLLCLTLGIAVKKRNGFEGTPVQNLVDQILDFVAVPGKQ